MLINLSNHPSSSWSLLQSQTANLLFGDIVDIPFPEIDPEWDEIQIAEIAKRYLQIIADMAIPPDDTPVVHLMGEYSFCFNLVNLLKINGIQTVVSTSKRHSVMNKDGSKTISFNFVKFRSY